MPKIHTTFNRQLLDGKQNNRLLNYASRHQNLKLLRTEIDIVSQKLTQLGYIENRVIERLQTNDSTYSEKFNLGNRIKYIICM
jgi:hypothetical protein